MLLASILIARILGREIYGEYGMIRSTAQMFLVFAGFGLGMTATKHVAQFRTVDPQRAGRIMALSGLFAFVSGLLIALLLIAVAPWVAAKTINAPHLAGELRIGAVILLLSAMNGAQTGALAGFEAFKTIAIVNFKVALLSFPFLVAGAYFYGLRGAIWALGLNMAINWLFNHLALRRTAAQNRILFTLKNCFQEWPILWKFSFPAALSGIMVSPVLWACNAMLVNHPGGYAQMGLFDAANQWRAAILFLPGMVGTIALPMLSDFDSRKDQHGYMKALKYNALLNGTAAMIIAVPIAILSRWIMQLYGPGFREGSLTLCILSLTTVLISLNSIVGQAITSKGKMWICFSFNLFWAIVLLISAALTTRQGYGANGLAVSMLFSYLCHSIWQALYMNTLVGYPCQNANQQKR